MPLASMSNATSICGCRAGRRDAGQVDMPSFLLYAAISRSPGNLVCTDGCCRPPW